MRRIALVVVVLLGSVPSVHAQPKPEGARLFEEGRALAKDGKYAEACERFQQSFAIERAPGTALNYGDCLEKLGQLRASWEMFESAAKDFESANDDRATFARERANAVAAKLTTITVRVARPGIPGMLIKIGDQTLPARAEHSDRHEPGEVTVVASAPGYEPFSTSVSGVAGASVTVEVPELRVVGEVVPDETIDGRRHRSRVHLAFGVGIAGAVAVGVGSIFGLAAKGQYDEVLAEPESCTRTAAGLVCTEEAAARIDIAATRADIATGAFVVGGLLVATGVVLYVTAPPEGVAVTPMATANTIGLSLSSPF